MKNLKSSNYFMVFLMIMWVILIFASSFLYIISDNFFAPIRIILISQLAVFGIPILFIIITNFKNLNNIFLFKKISLKNIIMIIGMTLSLIPFAMLLAIISSIFFGGNDVGDVVSEITQESGILISLFVVAVIPSFFEEIALRGVIFSGYKGKKIFLAAIVNGLFFAIIHMNMQQFLYAFILGVFFCYFVYYTKSIWAGIIAHLTVNSSQNLLAYFLSFYSIEVYEMNEYISEDNFEFYSAFIYISIFALIFISIFILIYRSFKKYNANVVDDEEWFSGKSNERILGVSFFIPISIFLIFILLFHFGG